jgi:hypothetical protein
MCQRINIIESDGLLQYKDSERQALQENEPLLCIEQNRSLNARRKQDQNQQFRLPVRFRGWHNEKTRPVNQILMFKIHIERRCELSEAEGLISKRPFPPRQTPQNSVQSLTW